MTCLSFLRGAGLRELELDELRELDELELLDEPLEELLPELLLLLDDELERERLRELL